MRVSKGYSEEIGHSNWIKGEVELDDSDMQRIALEYNITRDLTVTQVYAILSLEAERLLTFAYAQDLKSRGLNVSSSLVDRLDKTDKALNAKLRELVD